MPPEWWSAVTRSVPAATPAADPAAVLSTAPAYAGPQGGGVEDYIRQAAARRGIDPDVAVRVAQSEGGVTEPAKRGTFATGSSWWPFQLHYGGAGTPYEKYGTVAGMGNTFTAKTGYQPGDPEAWQAATDYALDAAKQQGWGAWYGARKQGITGFQGITKGGGAAPLPAPAPAPASTAPSWWQGVTGATDLMQRPGPPAGRQTLPEPKPAAGAQPQGLQPLASSTATAGPAPAWWTAVPGAAPVGGGTAPPGAPGTVGEAPVKQAVAASWALSNLGSKAFSNLCQRFIEQAYGTGGQFGSAAAAGKALFKTADPAQAEVGDLVFFAPHSSNNYAGHAAIYLGNGEMVGATNAGVTRDNIFTSPYWSKLLVGFGDPPEAWKGRASSGDLMKGAGQLVGHAKAAVQGTAQGAAQAAPDWWGAVTGRR